MVPKSILTAALTAAILFTAAGTARATVDRCPPGCVPDDHCVVLCKSHKRACLHRALLERRRCNIECLETSDDRTELKRCTHKCSVAYRRAKAECSELKPVCREICRPPKKDPACVKECAIEGRECVADVLEKGRKCAAECDNVTEAEQGGCLRMCWKEAKKGARECYELFHGCVDDCPDISIDVLTNE